MRKDVVIPLVILGSLVALTFLSLSWEKKNKAKHEAKCAPFSEHVQGYVEILNSALRNQNGTQTEIALPTGRGLILINNQSFQYSNVFLPGTPDPHPETKFELTFNYMNLPDALFAANPNEVSWLLFVDWHYDVIKWYYEKYGTDKNKSRRWAAFIPSCKIILLDPANGRIVALRTIKGSAPPLPDEKVLGGSREKNARHGPFPEDELRKYIRGLLMNSTGTGPFFLDSDH
jgi:hypothetical protein